MPAHLKMRDVALVATRPALLHAGTPRSDVCSKCGSRIALMDQEPCFSRCRMCGKLTPVCDTVIAEQMRFERSYGLAEHKVDWSEGRPLFHKKTLPKNGHKPRPE